MKDKPADTSAIQEATALAGSVRSVQVRAPAPGDPFSERLPDRVRVRALSGREITRVVNDLMPLIEAWARGLPPGTTIVTHAEECYAVLASATDKTAQYIGDLDGGDILAIFGAFLDENDGFFVGVTDLLYGATGERITRLFNGDGPTPSPSSTPMASPIQ